MTGHTGSAQAGNGGWGIASDGIRLWVTDLENDKVVRVAGDGVSFYPVGGYPVGVLFDGARMGWQTMAAKPSPRSRSTSPKVVGKLLRKECSAREAATDVNAQRARWLHRVVRLVCYRAENAAASASG